MVLSTPPPPLPPPVVTRPAAYQVSYGIVSGLAPLGTRRVVVTVDGRAARGVRLRGRSFTVDLDLPVGERVVRVVAQGADGRRSARVVRHVYGLPRAARPRARGAWLDGPLQRSVAALARSFGPSTGMYVQSLTTGEGAAWNARATFPAASTLKLAIAVTALARLDGPPRAGSSLDAVFRSMLLDSDNAAANRLESWFGGSTSGGSALVNATMRTIGLERTEMYGGYVVGTSLDPDRRLAGRPSIPLVVVDQPSWGIGKTTTALDLARLARAVWLASGGIGPLAAERLGVTAAEARYLLYLLAHVRDPYKLGRRVGALGGVAVLHKAGWVDDARHDAGLVVWRGGVLVAAVLTYRGSGAGTSSDVLAGRIAATALRRFRG
ncbi:MAG: serine hydrolase [Gaiella sp.]